jgi:AraC family transcriptional regulator of arabinose operon
LKNKRKTAAKTERGSTLQSTYSHLPQLAGGLADHSPGLVSVEWNAGDRLWNIGYTFSGTVREILPQGETWEHPHDFMLIKPGGSHCWEVPADAREPWQVVWFVFMAKPEWAPLLNLPEEFPHFSRIPLAGRKYDGKIRRSLLEAHWLANTQPDRLNLAMNALERALLWLQEELSSDRPQLDPRVTAAMGFFSRRLADPPSIPEAAEACGLSPSRLGKLFRQCTGKNPQQWLEQARLNHALATLSSTGVPVKQVAASVGYNDQRYFATRFRELFGLTPTQARKRRHA